MDQQPLLPNSRAANAAEAAAAGVNPPLGSIPRELTVTLDKSRSAPNSNVKLSPIRFMDQQQLQPNSPAAKAAVAAAAKQAADALPPVFPREVIAPPTGVNVRNPPLGSLPRELTVALDRSCSAPDCKIKFSPTEPATSVLCPHLFCTEHGKPMEVRVNGELQIGFACLDCKKPFEKVDFDKYKNGYFRRETLLSAHHGYLEETPGFRCGVCTGLHPRLNMVECTSDDCKKVAALQQKQQQPLPKANEAEAAAAAAAAAVETRMSCVWCACASHSTCYTRMIPIDRQPSPRLAKKEMERERLISFDWNYPAAWSLLHCAVCWTLLKPTRHDPITFFSSTDDEYQVWMACQHSICHDLACVNVNDSRTEKCGFCGACSDVSQWRWASESYLDKSYEESAPDFLATCESCQLIHPAHNFPDNDYKYCVWCKLTANAKCVKECEVLREKTVGRTQPMESGRANDH